MRAIALVLVAVATTILVASCKTTNNYRANYNDGPGVIDGARYKEQTPEQRTKNAFGTFMM